MPTDFSDIIKSQRMLEALRQVELEMEARDKALAEADKEIARLGTLLTHERETVQQQRDMLLQIGKDSTGASYGGNQVSIPLNTLQEVARAKHADEATRQSLYGRKLRTYSRDEIVRAICYALVAQPLRPWSDVVNEFLKILDGAITKTTEGDI